MARLEPAKFIDRLPDLFGKRSMSKQILTVRGEQSLQRAGLHGALLFACLMGVFSLTGCQVDVGGQTLPSPYYLQDDIQYFPAGPEFKLSKEAAALKAYKKELAEDESKK